jgi:uncharacterized repeat protein (TIGR03806 family)
MLFRFKTLFYFSFLILHFLHGHNLPHALNSQYYFDDFLKLKFNKPISALSPPGSSSLFVVEKEGKIFKIENLKNPKKELFLDFSHKVDAQGESGMLGLAFHPNYIENETYFVFYTSSYKNKIVQILSKIKDVKNEGFQEEQLIRQIDEAANHNGGDLHFGPDGYLYVSLGDEGKAGDFYQNSQRIDKDFFSGILRIDVNLNHENHWPNPHESIVLDISGKSRYKIPKDNPWVKTSEFSGKELDPKKVRSEFWAIGFRNPWRMSFDLKGNLWIGDVGQGNKEEINLIPNGEAGMNFGWAFREGSEIYKDGERKETKYESPVYEYGRKGFDATYLGRSVTGGLVCESEVIPELSGWYIFSDYVNGNVWAMKKNEQQYEIRHILHTLNIASFGAHPVTKEILAVAMNQGKILMLKKSEEENKPIPQKLSETGLFKNLKNLEVDNGFVAYKTNVEFWSDHAHQKKWFKLPNKEQYQYQKDKAWVSPAGTVWIQHFEMEAVRGKAESKFNLETRVLVRTHDGVYGLSYHWDNDQQDATLVEESGDFKSLKINVEGDFKEQTWRFPSRSECMMCHNSINGFNLGVTTKQLNHEVISKGNKQNYIKWLFDQGFVDKAASKQDLKKRFYSIHDENVGLNDRARSYLDVNCAMCHHKNGPTPSPLNMNAGIPIEQTRLFMKALNHLGNVKRKVVDPGKVETSVLLNRLRASEGYTKMPFIGNMEVDVEAANVIEDWIKKL